MGVVIYSDNFANINLYIGEISDNIAINYSKSNIITPKGDKATNFYSINSCIYGSVIFIASSILRMYNDFE